jgi:alginate O-acetyltransferase complex protein AlgJ
MRIAGVITGIAAVGMVSTTCAAPYEDIIPAFNRTTSRVMARHITVPTLANLDYAAYNANPLKYDPQQFRPKAPAGKVKLIDCTFGGLLGSPCAALDATPLTDAEKNMPVAWEALQNRVWKELKNDDFAKVASRINGEKWSDPSIFMPYQELTALYLHQTNTGTQLWVRIEFKPWVKFIQGVLLPQGKGGFSTVYGQLSTGAFDSLKLDQVINWIWTSYTTRVLNQQEVVDWANELASYWYPKINTDVMSLDGETVWPASTTEKDIKKTMSGKTIRNPLIVIRGNPLGTILYNIYTVDVQPEKPESTVSQTTSTGTLHTTDTLVSQNFSDNRARFKAELGVHGTYAAWADETKDFRARLKLIRDSLPKTQMGFRGDYDWVFFKKDIDYINGGDLALQQPDKNPLPHLLALKRYLAAHNVNLLFVPVPNKSEVYYSSLVPGAVLPQGTILNPYGRKFLKDAQDSGLEVIDLLPLFFGAAMNDSQTGAIVYQKQDTHWTNDGLQIAAQAIADRIKTYAWYSETVHKYSVCYTKHDTTFERLGDIVDKLADNERSAYPPVTLQASQVHVPDGSLYKGSQPQAPVLLMGDSFTGVFELIDCKGAGVGAHIAADTKLPVDIITSWGGGPLVREKMLRARAKDLSAKRVVVYMMVARDLYNYGEGWAPLDTNSASLHK